MRYVETISLAFTAYCIVRFVKLLPVMVLSLGLELCLLAAYTYNKNSMGETCVAVAYSSARQASGCPRASAPGRRQPHPNLAPKLMTTCNPAISCAVEQNSLSVLMLCSDRSTSGTSDTCSGNALAMHT